MPILTGKMGEISRMGDKRERAYGQGAAKRNKVNWLQKRNGSVKNEDISERATS